MTSSQLQKSTSFKNDKSYIEGFLKDMSYFTCGVEKWKAEETGILIKDMSFVQVATFKDVREIVILENDMSY